MGSFPLASETILFTVRLHVQRNNAIEATEKEEQKYRAIYFRSDNTRLYCSVDNFSPLTAIYFNYYTSIKVSESNSLFRKIAKHKNRKIPSILTMYLRGTGYRTSRIAFTYLLFLTNNDNRSFRSIDMFILDISVNGKFHYLFDRSHSEKTELNS